MSSQPSLFTRLTAVEAELSAMKDILAELKVNQDELRRDRDEWRWRAERLLADLQQGTWWRWCNRAAAALDAGTARFRGVLADVQNRLSEMKANRGDLRHGRDKWLSGAKGIPMDQRGSDSGGSAS
jgi:chromosome segregation ATPase